MERIQKSRVQEKVLPSFLIILFFLHWQWHYFFFFFFFFSIFKFGSGNMALLWISCFAHCMAMCPFASFVCVAFGSYTPTSDKNLKQWECSHRLVLAFQWFFKTKRKNTHRFYHKQRGPKRQKAQATLSRNQWVLWTWKRHC